MHPYPAPRRRRADYRRQATLLSVAVGLVGVTFGVLAQSAGASLAQALVLSACTFTGASQYALVSLIGAGVNPAAALGSALLLSARNALYGPIVAPILRAGGAHPLVAAHFVIDETTAMATAQAEPQLARRAFWFCAGWLFVLWNAGTAIGVIAGSALGDLETWGLDAAFPAAFIALLLPHLHHRRGQVAAAAGAAITVVAVPVLPAGGPILLAALAVVPALLVPAAGRDQGNKTSGNQAPEGNQTSGCQTSGDQTSGSQAETPKGFG